MRASFLLCTILTFLWLLSSLWKTTIEVCNYLCKYFYPQHYVKKKKKKMRAVYISVNGITKSVSGIYFFFIIDPLLILVMSLEGSVSYFFRLFFQVLHFGGSFDFSLLKREHVNIGCILKCANICNQMYLFTLSIKLTLII